MVRARYRSRASTLLWGLVIPGGGYLYRGSMVGFVLAFLLTLAFSGLGLVIWLALEADPIFVPTALILGLAAWGGALTFADDDTRDENRRFRAERRHDDSARLIAFERQLADLRAHLTRGR